MPSLIRKRLALIELMSRRGSSINLDDDFSRSLRLQPEESKSRSIVSNILQQLEQDGFISQDEHGLIRVVRTKKAQAESTYVDHLAAISHHVSDSDVD